MTGTFASSDVSLINFGEQQVRVVTINNTPWFVAIDVCAALCLARLDRGAGRHLNNLSPNEKTVTTLNQNGGRGRANPRVTVICESGLYKLVLRSDKPEAKVFQDWVTKEALPAIRKDGAYFKDEEKGRTGELSEDELVFRAIEIMSNKVERLTHERQLPPC
jgi:prophage antirepressor-like protein